MFGWYNTQINKYCYPYTLCNNRFNNLLIWTCSIKVTHNFMFYFLTLSHNTPILIDQNFNLLRFSIFCVAAQKQTQRK